MKKYRCTICGYIYDDTKENVKFEDLPDDWKCPLCGAPKSAFEEIKEEPEEKNKHQEFLEEEDELRSLTKEEIAYICSNLAKACEKQYLEKEQSLFQDLADYYETQIEPEKSTLKEVKENIQTELNSMKDATNRADEKEDRGTKRVLTWGTKTSNMMKIILDNYEEKGIDYIKNTKIWVCDICGFIYVGDEPPKICPVCKVPSLKILEVK